MIAIDKSTLTRIARELRSRAAEHGVIASHARFLDATCVALGFRDANAAIATLKERAILVRVTEDNPFRKVAPSTVIALNVARLIGSFGFSVEQLESDRNARLKLTDHLSQIGGYISGMNLLYPVVPQPSGRPSIWSTVSLLQADVVLTTSKSARRMFDRLARMGVSTSLSETEQRENWQKALFDAVMLPSEDKHEASLSSSVLRWIVKNSPQNLEKGSRHFGHWSMVDNVVATMARHPDWILKDYDANVVEKAALERQKHQAEQELIGKLLMHTPAPRMPFSDWWNAVNVQLDARDCRDDSTWGEAAWRYREHRLMTPAECANAILEERGRASKVELHNRDFWQEEQLRYRANAILEERKPGDELSAELQNLSAEPRK